MNFVSKNMLAIALLLSIPAGLLSSQAAPVAKTVTEQAAPVAKEAFNKTAELVHVVAQSQGVQKGWQAVKQVVGIAAEGVVANAKVIVPATLKYAFTWAGDGSYADIACSAAAKVAVTFAVVKSINAVNDAYAWWYGPADQRSWFDYLTKEYDRKGNLKKKPLVKESIALGLALMFIMGQTSNKTV